MLRAGSKPASYLPTGIFQRDAGQAANPASPRLHGRGGIVTVALFAQGVSIHAARSPKILPFPNDIAR